MLTFPNYLRIILYTFEESFEKSFACTFTRTSYQQYRRLLYCIWNAAHETKDHLCLPTQSKSRGLKRLIRKKKVISRY